jgi:hypothetical protein
MWGPSFSHNISLFYPEAILGYFGITPANPYYVLLMTRITAIIELEVKQTAFRLNKLVREAFRKDLYDIDEYNTLPEYEMALDNALSSPIHVGVSWGKKLVQARFIDTNYLGGLSELIEIQKEVYPSSGSRNLGAWASLYRRWLDGTDERIGETLRRRLSIMMSRGIAPFAELIETGNDMYPAYPTHSGKHTLRDFKPTYNREMRAAFQKVLRAVEGMLATLPPSTMIPEALAVSGTTKTGYSWTARSGNTIFVLENSIKMSGNRFVGSGFVLSTSGNILKGWHGWLPK